MIDRNQLRRLNTDSDLPLHILEQDYVQSLFLTELYKKSDNLVFKGGTYLRHAHGLDRFSEDLDFSATSQFDVSVLEEVTKRLSDYNLDAELLHTENKEVSVTSVLRYSGPLYDGSDRSRGNIELEISNRDDVFLEPSWIKLFFVRLFTP